MAYGLKYYYDFYWDHDSSKNDYRAAFYFDGYASTTTQLTPTDTPVIQKIDGQKDSTDQVIMGSEIKLEFLVTKNLRVTYDADFIKGGVKDCVVKIIQDPTGAATVKWAGLLRPSNSDRTYQGFKINYKVSATDIFSFMKKKYYTTDGTQDGSNYTDFEELLTIIKTSVSTIADISELQFPFRIQLGTYSDLMTSTESALKENEVAQQLFYQDKGDRIVTDTSYSVIEKILRAFYCSIVHWDGYYWIFCHSERDSYYFEYDWSTLTQQSRTAHNRTVQLFGTSTTMQIIGKGTLSNEEGLQFIYTTLKNRSTGLALIPNEQFDSNITGWTNGDADNNSNTFTVIAWDDLAGTGGTLEATWAGSASTGKYNFHNGTPFTVDLADDPGVTISYSVQVTSSTGSTFPKVQVRLYNSTDGYKTSGNGQHTLSLEGNFYNFSDTFNTSSLTAASNYVDFELEVTNAATTQITINVNYIIVTQESTLTPNDWLLKYKQVTEEQTGIKEYDLYIADQIESEDDIFSIKDTGGNYTSTWDRYGMTDTLPLMYLLNRQILNDYADARAFIKCKIYDPNEAITPYSLLYDNTSGVTYYRIVGMTRNYREATVDVNLIESEHIASDTLFFSGLRKLSTSYGS